MKSVNSRFWYTSLQRLCVWMCTLVLHVWTESALLLTVLLRLKAFQSHALLWQFRVSPFMLLHIKYDIKYNLQSELQQRKTGSLSSASAISVRSPPVTTICWYIVSMKTQTPDQSWRIYPCVFGRVFHLQRHLLKQWMKLHISFLLSNKPSQRFQTS